MFSCFDKTPACDRRASGRTDRQTGRRPATAQTAWRSKKRQHHVLCALLRVLLRCPKFSRSICSSKSSSNFFATLVLIYSQTRILIYFQTIFNVDLRNFVAKNVTTE